jgi:dienelactone hydrolase
LDSKIDEQKEFSEYTRQKISFNAAYGGERMFGYLFLPEKIKPPYQTVIYFPGSHVIHNKPSEKIELNNFMDFYVKSGRALFYPIYKSTFERGDNVLTDIPDSSNLYKDHVIMWTKDVRRSIDYLESRKDINSQKIAYYGYSWGGYMGGIIPAVEKRIKAVILVVAGLDYVKTLPEAKTNNFISRITQPVLMLNGKYDFFFPYETAQKPFFNLLGTRDKDKKMKVYYGGHSVPYAELAKESLIWLDKYLGKIDND